jgi:hypothetical protein
VKKKLDVIISGPAASGKSTLGVLINKLLLEEAVKVEPFVDAERRQPVAASEQQDQIDWLISATQTGEVEINIVEVYQRTSPGAGIEAIHQRGLLINSLNKFFRQAGVIAQEAPQLSGPELLYQLEIFGEHLASKEAA